MRTHSHSFLLIAACFVAQAMWTGSAHSQNAFGYTVTEEVVYGQAIITRDGAEVSRDLWMDVYQPEGKASQPRPAVIMTFGGAFHRGSPRATTESGGATDTSMADYCRSFAAAGYTCFAIDYRLTTEGPVLSGKGYDPDTIKPDSLLTLLPQINHIRSSVIGVPTVDFEVPEQRQIIVNGVIGAAEDLRKAVDFVRGSSADFNIDPHKIVLGGFSAGAVTSWNVAHGMGAPVAGVFLLSGADSGFDIKKTVTPTSGRPPILLIMGQNDLADGLANLPSLLAHYEASGVRHSFAWVPAFGHFYPAGSTSLGADGSKMAVRERIMSFLADTIGTP